MKSGGRAVIIGAGHNGLVAACYLARAGLKPLVLERRSVPGGAVVTEELFPGFKCPVLAHSSGPLLPGIIKDLQLARLGLEEIVPEVRTFAAAGDGDGICIFQDDNLTCQDIARVSRRDATSFPDLQKTLKRLGSVLRPLLLRTAPEITGPSLMDVWSLGKLGIGFRALDKKDSYRLLRWPPMAVADLAAEWFETDLLRAVIAARGIYGAFAGPWSAGTGMGVLWQSALDGQTTAPAIFFKGGIGALSGALLKAATESGAEVRTGASVAAIRVRNQRAIGLTLESGEEISAALIVSNSDPRQTFLNLLDPMDLDPEFLGQVRNYRSVGTAAKINLALSGLPNFSNSGESERELSGRIHIGPGIDYLEQAFDAAKYGEYSPKPYMDITIPSLSDPSLAPGSAHVMSVYVQFAPYHLKSGDWISRKDEFADSVIEALSSFAPNLKELIVHRQTITPYDLEQTYGLTGGHIMHGEQSLDQLFAFRPLIGWAQYRTPIKGLYLCGAGTHPGGGVTGGPGAVASRQILRDLKREIVRA